jgi:methylmalonyl-CoA mutase C-terminal domain/subunit
MQEDVDAVGLSSLSGAHKTLFPQVVAELADRGGGDIVVFGGGVIPSADLDDLAKAGLAQIFTPGSPLDEIAEWVDANVRPRSGREKH